MAALSKSRFLLFLLSTWLFIFVGAEILARVGVQLLPGSSPLRRLAYPSRYSLHRMARLVDDKRVATLIPGYRGVLSDPVTAPWQVEIDENGFRGRAEYYVGKRHVMAFIGDSVPFGWGVSNEASVPAQLQGLLREQGFGDIGVLNGAIPSYTLTQTVERFQREISGKYPVKSVILQTLGSAGMFSLLGEGWNPSISYNTRYREPMRPLMGRLEDYLDKSLIFSVGLRIAYRSRQGSPVMESSVMTESAWRKFDHANEATLSALVDAARTSDASVVVLPVNPGPDPETVFSDRERRVVDHFNRFLETFASSRPGVYFFDVNERFEVHPRRADLFVDLCCHLSEQGAGVQARYLLEKYRQTGLLPLPE